MITRLVLHPKIKIGSDFNDKVYIGLTTSLDQGVLVELLEQIDGDRDAYFDHIDGFSLFRIASIGLEHIDGISTCDTEIPQLDLDKERDYVLKITGVDEV
jgi:hypothetical protein